MNAVADAPVAPPQVFTFDCLSEEFCDALLGRADGFVDAQSALREDATTASPDESLFNKRHVSLDLLGLGSFLDILLSQLMRPLAALLFADLGELDWRYGYIIGYAAAADGARNITRTSLVSHSDDSEVTLSVCLGREFEGGDVVFRGLRGSKAEGREEGRVAPTAGRGTLHAGQHLHEVSPVTSGQRYMLIVWTRSSGYRGTTCPCCLMNRRGPSECVCGPSWN